MRQLALNIFNAKLNYKTNIRHRSVFEHKKEDHQNEQFRGDILNYWFSPTLIVIIWLYISRMEMAISTAMGTLPSLFLINMVIQWTGWVLACWMHTEKFYDLTGSSTFLLVVSLCYSWHSRGHPRQTIQTAAVITWCIRLGSYLFLRILASGRDRRFDKTRDYPVRFFYAWTIQGVWVAMTLFPTLLCLMSRKQPALGNRDYIGWGTWLMGFLLETIADYQKTSFRNNPANEGKFISTGLWSLSRHPNYFGEILLWFGLYVSASSTFSSYEYLTVLCPTLVYLLITRVSGIPMLESYGLHKWGTSPEYRQYVKNTPLLVPFWH